MQKDKVIRYLRYYLRAETIYRVHSPYVFQLIQFVCDEERLYYDFQILAKLRHQLERSALNVQSNRATGETSIQSTSYDAIHRATYERLYRLVLRLNPKNIMELGASHPLTTLSIALASKSSALTCHTSPLINVDKFQSLLPEDSRQRISFSDTWTRQGSISDNDMLIIHPGLADNVHDIIDPINRSQRKPHSIIVFGIHHSDEMETVWNKFKNQLSYNVKLDLYDFGLIQNLPDLETNIDFTYIDYRKKWWQMGFF